MTSGTPEDRIELRLALVCYGGVSLAVYMHGVTKELHKLVRASRRFDDRGDGPNPFGSDDTEWAYFEALRQLAGNGRRLSVSIDIIAGTSAGGINGVVLGKVLAVDGSQDSLKTLWIREGDLRKLLRGLPVGGLRFRAATAALWLLLRAGTATSPLKGERMSRLLLKAIREIDDGAPAQGTLLPEQGTLDLYVTLTDLHGFQIVVPTGAGGASQRERQHAQVLHFSARKGETGGFGPDATPDLAFAARATSSFPGAFAPVGVRSFADECGAELDREALTQRFAYRYDEQNVQAVDAWFVDGGTLDNAPFDLVVSAIGQKRAETQVVRRIVYVQPDPGEPLVPSQPVSGPAEPPPSWFSGIRQAVGEVKGTHSVLRDLVGLRDLNMRIAEVGAIAESQMSEALALIDRLLPRAENDPRSWMVSGKTAVQAVSVGMHAQVRERLGPAFLPYCRLKVEAAARRLADEVAEHFVFPPDSSRTSFIRAAIGAWARGREEWDDPDPTGLLRLLAPVDVPYRERRLRFIVAGINELYADAGTSDGKPRRAELDGLKGKAWDLLDELRRVPAAVAGQMPEAVDFLSAPRLDDDLLSDPRGFAEDHAEDFQALFTRYSSDLEKGLGDGSTPLWEAFEQTTAEWDKRYRRLLLARYLGFPFWDALIFPTVALSELPQFSPIGVSQFSPLTAAALKTPEGGKLKGIPLQHFAGFVAAEYRENDYLWGRLDAAELILRTLHDAGSAAPSRAATTAPTSQDAAVRTAGGSLLQEALRAAVESESGLTRIAKTRADLLTQIAELPLAQPVAAAPPGERPAGAPAPRSGSDAVGPVQPAGTPPTAES
jgi:patatin-related protein